MIGMLTKIILPPFKKTVFQLDITENIISLNILHVTKDDEAMYFCGMARVNVVEFSSGIFLSVRDKAHLDVSVVQSGVSDSVPAGASVTLQCSVLSESRLAELQVLWFRAAPPQSHPQIIYTHHNSSHQCESGSSTHTCVYNFPKNILSLNDTGTYYCAVAMCGKIIFGNGTRVHLGKLHLLKGILRDFHISYHVKYDQTCHIPQIFLCSALQLSMLLISFKQ
ncbi:uncharacterized protein LOC128611980 isoform X1 [Ictalurus furcatus]|uniref:uncharacterized protein LOC128611980 isoform X1 n=1 Tax=Ictalurus furcatus TaxID=66913 RepID=UPI00234FC252|nr:uncharacterized protein LOC128611980 isoform X1 [Ictalurus furcatus]